MLIFVFKYLNILEIQVKIECRFRIDKKNKNVIFLLISSIKINGKLLKFKEQMSGILSDVQGTPVQGVPYCSGQEASYDLRQVSKVYYGYDINANNYLMEQ